MASTVVTYIRGDTIVQNMHKGKMAHGLVGQLWVHGLCFDAMERMDGMVKMAESDDYSNSSMYWMDKYNSYVINPWLGRKAEATNAGEILFHPAGAPSDLLGCVGVGFFKGGVMMDSRDALAVIWEQCGGAPNSTTGQVVMTLQVQGKMPDWTTCPAWHE